MNHETLQALYALDLAEVGEKEAAKRWEFWRGDAWVECFQTIKWNSVVLYRRKPGIPWPKKIQPDLAAYKAEINRLQARLNQEQPKQEWPADAPKWANYLTTVYSKNSIFTNHMLKVSVIERPKPVLKKIDWSKVTYSITRMWHPEHDTDNPLTGWIAWNCDEYTRGNPLPDGLVVEGYNISSEIPWTNNNPHITWKVVRCFRIVGIQEGWE